MARPELTDTINTIDAASTLAELKAAMQTVASGYGFSSWCFVDAGRAYQNVPAHVSSPGNEWNEIYRDNGFVHVDPYIAKARRWNTPFEWASIPSEPVKRGPKSATRKLMESAYDFGFTEGLIVPFHFRDDIGRNHSTLCVFHWRENVRDFGDLFARKRAELHLSTLYFTQRAMTLLASEERVDPLLSTQTIVEDRVLTDRERDIMAWSARGKTAAETAEILAISNTTVEKHIANIMAKLDASNRTHAVAKCITMGLIDL